MAEFPTLDLRTDAYLADTGHLSDEEHGRYILILIYLWRAPNQRFPDDDGWLARKFSRPVGRVRSELRPLLSEFCQSDGNWITQKRISREFFLARKRSRAATESAKSRWRNKKSYTDALRLEQCFTDTDTDTDTGSESPVPSARTEIDKSRSTQPRRARKKLRAVGEMPSWLPLDAWNAYVEMRSRIRAPMTDRAKALELATLEKLRAAGQDPLAVLDQSVQKSWRGLYPVKSDDTRNRTAHDSHFAGIQLLRDELETCGEGEG